MITLERHGEIAELRLQHEKVQNPFSMLMTRQLIELSRELEADDAVGGVLLWGGKDRSFSVGGDFRDVRTLTEEQLCLNYLREIVQSYQAVLRISKPVVVAIDHYAIGQGLQVAMMGDWRIGSERSCYQMPELANGVACPLGSLILETFFGRALMLELVNGNGSLDAAEARRIGLINEVVSHADLEQAAMAKLRTLVDYAPLPYRLTKQIHNQRLVEGLEQVREPAARAHARCFLAGNAQSTFSRILDRAQ